MGKLFVVGTPLGNLNDISKRAIDTLSTVDFIAAEDTRVTIKLLNRFGINKPLVSYHQHNEHAKSEQIIQRLISGECCALVSDAGMPAISDPGNELISQCREKGIEIESVPGPTAFATAIAISGLCTGRFTFEGFLSVNKKNRTCHLQELKYEERTMIFYEAPHKLLSTLKDMLELIGERKIALCRELTKIHEEVIVTTFSDAITKYTETTPKGEFVLVVEGGTKKPEHDYTLDDAIIIAQDLADKGFATSTAAKEAAAITGFKKSDIYKQLITKK